MERSGCQSAAVLDRREMLSYCLGILGLSSTWKWDAATRPGQYRRLTKPVVIPLEDVAEVWRPVEFDALAPAPDPNAGFGPNVALKGVLLRLPANGGGTHLKAFALTCPHELCPLNYVEDTATVRVEPPAETPDHPLLVCPCHFSVFNLIADGARLYGPAPRSLYRFRFEIEGDEVAITEVEEEALG